jgi:hypothetical protein
MRPDLARPCSPPLRGPDGHSPASALYNEARSESVDETRAGQRLERCHDDRSGGRQARSPSQTCDCREAAHHIRAARMSENRRAARLRHHEGHLSALLLSDRWRESIQARHGLALGDAIGDVAAESARWSIRRAAARCHWPAHSMGRSPGDRFAAAGGADSRRRRGRSGGPTPSALRDKDGDEACHPDEVAGRTRKDQQE